MSSRNLLYAGLSRISRTICLYPGCFGIPGLLFSTLFLEFVPVRPRDFRGRAFGSINFQVDSLKSQKSLCAPIVSSSEFQSPISFMP